jgi:hypothetical protein
MSDAPEPGFSPVLEELFWGDAGIEMSLVGSTLVGSTLAALAVVANGTPEQVGEWCPQMFGGPGDVKLGAARLLAWRAAWMAHQGRPFRRAEGSMSKLVAGRQRSGSPSRPSRSWAGTATPGISRWSAGTATRRSSPSSRAPRRSSASSSAAPSPVSTSGS